jgi:hypothetical protein
MKITLEQIKYLERFVFQENKKLVGSHSDYRKATGFFQHADKHCYQDEELLIDVEKKIGDILKKNKGKDIADPAVIQASKDLESLAEQQKELLKKEYDIQPDPEHLSKIKKILTDGEGFVEVPRKVMSAILDAFELS